MKYPFLSVLLFISLLAVAQPRVISGPMLGPVELRDARIWVEVSPEVKTVAVRFSKAGEKNSRLVAYDGILGRDFNPVCITAGGLETGSTYEYEVLINGKSSGKTGTFTTKELWQWRKPVPDFSFLTGSCSYFNEPVFDRPGTPYGKDSSVFLTMAKEKAAFMLWLGDAWYTRETDYYSEWGLWYRASRDRSLPVLQPFLKAMPQLAIWDDHDYGPNDIGKHYILKEASRKVFSSYFCNPSAGENGQGIYTMTSWGDADIFMTDNRWWRSADRMKDSVNGRPNPAKKMLGDQQMEWLKNALLYSNATFKIIAMGSQALNPVSPYDKWADFPAEYQEFMDFIAANNITGVLFLTGDRHHSEIIRVERPGRYPLYDITVSPLTSGIHSFGGPEKNNPYRIFGLDEKQNYARFDFSGERGKRKLTVQFLGVKGEDLGKWSVSEKELKNP
ncbi:MAG: alkaline phosphatase family protein [Chitinophagaceae bacterium]|nr:alkaline phosphatase family protein [Chitinophagaceae bacterium]